MSNKEKELLEFIAYLTAMCVIAFFVYKMYY